MKWCVEFTRRTNGFTQPGQAGRAFRVEVCARTADEARTIAQAEGTRLGRQLRAFDMQAPRKV